MKKIILIVVLVCLAAVAYGANWLTTQSAGPDVTIQITTLKWEFVDTITVPDSGAVSTTQISSADLTQGNDYWNGATMRVLTSLDDSASDSSRTITDFAGTGDLLTFATFGSTLDSGDVVELRFRKPYIFKANIDTTPTYSVIPGAALTSVHLMNYTGNKDSTTTKVYLQIAVAPVEWDARSGWFTTDSITYNSQDTLVYKAWGAQQARYFRFIFDPQTGFTDTGYVSMYGTVIADK